MLASLRYALCVLIWTLITACSFRAAGVADPTAPDARGAELDGRPIDARALDASPPGSDAADPQILSMSETGSSEASPGHAIYCHSGTTRDNHWARVFALADFGVTGAFEVIGGVIAPEQARSATVTIAVHGYAGPVGGLTLDASAFVSPSASATGPIADSDQPQSASLPVDVTFPAGTAAIVVEVSSVDVYNADGTPISYLHAGATTAGESARAYYASDTCGIDTLSSQSVDTVIDVVGYAL